MFDNLLKTYPNVRLDTQDNDKEIQKLWADFNSLIPKTFTVETSVACELKCPECALGSGLMTRKKGVMSFERFKIIADKIRPFAKYLLLHMYGEPMINKDIFKIIRYASEIAPTNISTNGMAMTEEMAENLITSGVRDLIVSIDGYTQETYALYRRGGDIKKAFAALEMLQRSNIRNGRKVNIVPQYVVFRHNQHEVLAFAEYCKSLELFPSFKAPHLRPPTPYENSEIPQFIRKQYPDRASQLKAMRDCSDPREVFTIHMDGSVIVCCYDYNGQTTFGNIFEQDVMEIWNSPNYKKFRWDIVSGNAPKFCIDKCLLYIVPEPVKAQSAQNDLSCTETCVEAPDPLEKKIIDKGSEKNQKQVPRKPIPSPDCLFLNTYYAAFLDSLYKKNPGLRNLSYSEQKQAIQNECFGDADFYSEGLTQNGLISDDLIINCEPLQAAWARENGATGSILEIAIEQVKRMRPKIVYLQDVNLATPEFIAALRSCSELVVAQHGSPIPSNVNFGLFDVLFTCAPHFVERFRKTGVAAYYQPLSFDERLLPLSMPFNNRPIEVSFVGGLSNLHVNSYALLETLAKRTPLYVWGYGVNTLPTDSAVRSRHQGEAWGRDMFKVLGQSKITVNRHGEIAENYACNMRLFEATGCGALLITDYKDNLQDLFDIGKEVVAYRSPDECATLIQYYIRHPDEAEKIARAGQERTFKDHTYRIRMNKTSELLVRHLRYRKEKDLFTAPDMNKITYGHTRIESSQVSENMTLAWQNPAIPERQRALVQPTLAAMYKGECPAAYRVLADIMRPYIYRGISVLELGCSSGYCYEMLEYLLSTKLEYTGVDYSAPMIEMARDYYPWVSLYTADGASLFFADRYFDIVISSCVLLHVPNYRQHIFETVRVAKKYIVASRTPVCRKRPTQYQKKFAYEIETVELIFNENELIREFKLNNVNLVNALQYNADEANDLYEVTYLFAKN